MLGAWSVNQISAEPASDIYVKTDAIASDGNFIYVHTASKGLRKIGTGYGHTIQGHVYDTNANYRVDESQKSIALINDKLYYLLHKAPLSASSPAQNSVASILPEASPSPLDSDSLTMDVPEDTQEEVVKHIQIAVIDCTSLKVRTHKFSL